MQKKLLSWLFMGFVVVMASCSKDEDITTAPDVQAEKPTDTLYVNDSITLRPLISNKNGVSFKWIISGNTVGTDSIYKFKATESGDFKVVVQATNSIGSGSDTFNIHVWSKYENGFFILSEGQFLTAAGNLNFYDYGLDSLYINVYSTENPGSTLGGNTSTMEYGAIIDNKFYLVGKYGAPLVTLNPTTLKETGRIADLPGSSGRAIVGVTSTQGWLSSVDGIYGVSLAGPTLGLKLATGAGDTRDMLSTGTYVFALSATEGVKIFNTADGTVAKTISGAVTGFATGKDGSIWAASKKALIRINPSTLAVDSVQAGFDIYYNQWDFVSGSIVTSTADDAVFIISGTSVYRYVPGNASSLSAPFITLPAGKYFYGKGIAYNKTKNQLIVTATGNEYGDNNNSLYFYNASNATLINTVNYTGYYYPAMIVFH